MAFSIHSQHIDAASKFHVIELRDGKIVHFVQIALGADHCPACGRLTPKDNLDSLDPKALVGEINAALNKSQADVTAYALKHGLAVK
jgi:hypothetical protein